RETIRAGSLRGRRRMSLRRATGPWRIARVTISTRALPACIGNTVITSGSSAYGRPEQGPDRPDGFVPCKAQHAPHDGRQVDAIGKPSFRRRGALVFLAPSYNATGTRRM